MSNLHHKFLRQEADVKRILRDKTTSKDKQIDAIYDLVDELMLSGSFDHIDKILSDSKLHDLDIMLAYLVATLPAKDKLKCRDEYFDRVWDLCLKMNKNPFDILCGL